MFTFKLNSGSHGEGKKIHKSGDTIETESDLRVFNVPGVTPRFELLSEEASKQPEADTPEKPLEEMHVKQLDKIARGRGIDTDDLKTREDYLVALGE